MLPKRSRTNETVHDERSECAVQDTLNIDLRLPKTPHRAFRILSVAQQKCGLSGWADRQNAY